MSKEHIYLENFQAGHLEKGLGFRYFVPTPINIEWRWNDPMLNTLLEKASIKLGELNSFARLVPDIGLFIQLHVTKEAVVSSRIEGTQTNMNEALIPVEEINPDRRNDWQEVRNYTNALNQAIDQLKELPLSSRVLCQAHKTLMQGVRGEHKLPGEFRSSQNWIGGATLMDAVFIPPGQHYVQQLMGDLENFLHNNEINVPALIRIGMAHYHFETIHPFLDGNGRIGRLLITLYLVSQKILDQPLLYLSAFFEKNKTVYYDNLTAVRQKNDMLQWLKYFLIGVEETATKAVQTLSAVMQLKTKLESEMHDKLGRRSHSGLKLLTELFKYPVTTPKKVEGYCNLSKKAALDLVASFEEQKWLVKVGDAERYRTYLFEPYLRQFD